MPFVHTMILMLGSVQVTLVEEFIRNYIYLFVQRPATPENQSLRTSWTGMALSEGRPASSDLSLNSVAPHASSRGVPGANLSGAGAGKQLPGRLVTLAHTLPGNLNLRTGTTGSQVRITVGWVWQKGTLWVLGAAGSALEHLGSQFWAGGDGACACWDAATRTYMGTLRRKERWSDCISVWLCICDCL
jgi:hypothetical protein